MNETSTNGDLSRENGPWLRVHYRVAAGNAFVSGATEQKQ